MEHTDINQRIMLHIKTHNFSFSKLAPLISTTQQNLGRVLLGTGVLKLNQYILLCDVFKVRLSYFLGEKEEADKQSNSIIDELRETVELQKKYINLLEKSNHHDTSI